MNKFTEEVSDAVLYRNLYTDILNQQINYENRLHRLMIACQGQDKTFDEHFKKVRAKVEKDRMKIQKLGERLVLMEKKEMETVSKSRKVASGDTPIKKENKPGVLATLLNMESLRDQFNLGQKISPKEQNEQMKTPDPVTSNQHNDDQKIIDPQEIEVFFENPFSQNKRNITPTKPMDSKQGHSKKLKRPGNYPWFASQAVLDDLPKRVSFNDIPDVIAGRKTGNAKLLANEEAGWNSDFSEDGSEVTSENNFTKQSVKRYKEPPPDFNIYSYHDHNRQNDPETSPKTSELARIRNQKKAEHLSKSSPKYQEAVNGHDESWDLDSEHGNSPFGSPWEGVIATSLQRQRNDSTQAVPSSTTNNEAFLDDLLCSKTLQDNEITIKRATDTFKNIETSNKNTATIANHFKTETTEQKKNDEHSSKDSASEEEIDAVIYEHVSQSKDNTKFIKDDALTAMRRHSWSIHPPDKKKKRGRLGSIFRRPAKNSQRSQVIEADRKQFHVDKKVRKRMSIRPLPDTPDVEDSEHAMQLNTAYSLDTFH